MSRKKTESVGILGGGMQGCCMALLFKKSGFRVTIIDQAASLISRASSNQEGKIHMGFIYAKDPSCKTGFKLLNDGLHFDTCLEELLEKTIPWDGLKSKKFIYLVPRDSLCSVDHLQLYFKKLQDKYESILASYPHLSYLGSRPENISYSIPVPEYVNESHFIHCFQTEEVAVSQSKLRDLVLKKLLEKEINVKLNTKVIGIKKQAAYQYEVTTPEGSQSFDFLVNCLWENQQIMDQQLGCNDRREINLRLKFGITSSYLNELSFIPSISMVSGQYGDFVNFQTSTDPKMYFSWYPISRYGMVVDQSIPEEWNDICNHNFPDHLFQFQIDNQLAIYQKLFSKNFKFIDPQLVPGIIVARGNEDIGNHESELHQRSENPVFCSDGYFSISTGKFTSIPYNTHLASLLI
ncbi:MAG: FAD-dependent oxidoreductase, partial [Saprospiraceae bacterium]|nr:FAD-dependent oxidoreductase [Saprospiraceae bacterium]